MVGIAPGEEASIDVPIVALTVLLALITSLMIGLILAIQSTRSSRQRSLVESLSLRAPAMPRQQRLRQVLMVFELAVALVSLIGAGLMPRHAGAP